MVGELAGWRGGKNAGCTCKNRRASYLVPISPPFPSRGLVFLNIAARIALLRVVDRNVGET